MNAVFKIQITKPAPSLVPLMGCIIQSGMICSVVYPASGLTCYTCACESVYKYSSADCPTPPYILSDQCKGKYKSCSCDTTLYPTTSATGGCPYGFIPDINNYCDDKPDGTKHYACVKPECKPAKHSQTANMAVLSATTAR